MRESKLKQALREAAKEEYQLQTPETHEFSEGFEKKMQRLMQSPGERFRRITVKYGWIAACLFVPVVLAAFGSQSMIKAGSYEDYYLDFFVEDFIVDGKVEHSTFTPMYTRGAPETLEERYEITYDLSGFEIYYESCDEVRHEIDYLKEVGDGEILQVIFRQEVKSRYRTGLNTENTVLETELINGKEAVYFKIHNHPYHIFLWDNGDYILYLSTNLDKETAIEVAESIRKVAE